MKTHLDSGFLRATVLLATGVCLMTAVSGCMHPLRSSLAAYRDAKKRGDYNTAAAYLAPDARIWFGEKTGPGAPLTARGGPWKDWDRFFNSAGTREDERVSGRTVTYVSYETNDFYRLLDRKATAARVTYYFNDHDKITGMFYRALSPNEIRPPDRRCEFEKWAEHKYPGEIAKLEPGGRIDPALENARRWKTLLVEWRQETGLPPVG